MIKNLLLERERERESHHYMHGGNLNVTTQYVVINSQVHLSIGLPPLINIVIWGNYCANIILTKLGLYHFERVGVY